MKRLPFVLVAALIGACAPTDNAADAAGDGTPADDTSAVNPRARVHIVQPVDGTEVQGPDVRVVLTAENITIAPAGDPAPNTGHHHLFLNLETVPEGQPIPAGMSGIIHLGQAQTEHTFTGLSPGEYTLIAVIGDLAHRVIQQDQDTVRFRVR
ncbi:MAG TPA: DUF4399 domain-containing protein [Longimicrobiales bacterium]|nr:DUF4399 domain-containing protein [Longimicrobiales bacterium]